jgi:predicted glycosyltransferase
VFLYSHDTFGLGHLRRNLAIAGRLLAHGRFSVRLLTGSPVIASWSLPRGLDVQPLPPVVKVAAETYAARTPGEPFGLVKGYREALILRLVLRHRPDVFLVDHAPSGMNGELLSTLALIRREMPGTRTILGLRDILDSPAIVRDLWSTQDIHALLDRAYDDIFVYGSQRLFDVVNGYGMSPRVAERVRYCGYVVNAAGDDASGEADGVARRAATPCWNAGRAGGRPVVLVTAGGGGDGHAMMDAYLRALAALPEGRFHSVLVTGPLMPGDEAATLHRAAAGRSDIEVLERTTDLVPSLRAADLVVSMAGYNTSVELIAARKRAILVPRAAPRAEQRMRAALLSKLGLMHVAHHGPRLAEQLAALLPAALAAPAVRPEAWDTLDLRGTDRVAEHLQTCVASRSASLEPAA